MMLEVRWHRLVDAEGKTCDRCAGTEAELRKAVDTLTRALAPVGIRVRFVEKALGAEECRDDIMESNRIWIAERPLEDWLDAEVDSTACDSCCETLGETVECRTTTVAGRSFEVIPAQLIVKAGLQAAATLIAPSGGAPCCPPGDSSGRESGACCP